MLNPVSPPSESSILGVVVRTTSFPYIKDGKKSVFSEVLKPADIVVISL